MPDKKKPAGARAPVGVPTLKMSRRAGGRVMAGVLYVPPAVTKANEVQVVTVDATSGTYKLTFQGQQTAPVAFDAAAATVKAALVALSNITAADVTVTGTAGGPYTVTFAGDLAETNLTQMVADSTLLVGGTATATVTTTTQGSN